MKTTLIALVTGAVMSAITAAVLLLVVAADSSPASTGSAADAELELVAASPSEVVSALPNDARVSPTTEVEAASIRPAFDPVAIYQRVAPAVVTINTDLGAGSGFFIDNGGHIVTNHHVIENANRIEIRTFSGETAEATLVGSDPANDLAVIRIDPADITIVLLDRANLTTVQVGDLVAAVGAPYGLEHSLSTGVISGLGRTLPGPDAGGRAQFSMIQTDTALNPGNSGGILVDANGALLGVPSRIESPIRAYTGVAFAIPVDTLDRVLPRMLAGEHIQHPHLGVSLGDQLDVRLVVPNSAAARAGLRNGDIILAIGGQRVDSFESLVATLETLTVGDTAPIQIERNGLLRHLTIDLEPWPTSQPPQRIP